MSGFPMDMRDVRFNLFDFLKLESLCQTDLYKEFEVSDFDAFLEAAHDISAEVLYPLNERGDQVGVRLEDGRVIMPEGWKKAYEAFVEQGWNGLCVRPEHGGQGIPTSVLISAHDMFIGSNLAFMFIPGLTTGALNLIASFGTEAQREIYLENMLTGRWAGTMCITEAEAGTAVPDLRSTATPIEGRDGYFKIKGQKVFISAGDQDCTENIAHMVLARVEGDPMDYKGISLFVVPRIRPDGTFNDVNTVGLEEKLGIHASPTTTLAFGENDDCEGWLIGEQRNGLKCMFQMMNESRIAVGAQGMGIANVAYLKAVAYAKERIQGVHITEMRNPNAERVAIAEHPDVRRMLLKMKALAEGSRALVYYAAFCNDQYEACKQDVEAANPWLHQMEILTPIVKAWCSDEGFAVTELGVQVLGGYGYCREYGMEQLLRDVKIGSIYEGTNGIQALDLLGRKMARKGGQMLMTTLAKMAEFPENEGCGDTFDSELKALERSRDAVTAAAFSFMQANMTGDMGYPALHACDFLQMMGDSIVAWLLTRQAMLAHTKLNAHLAEKGLTLSKEDREKILTGDVEARYLDGKIAAARFFCHQILPRVNARLDSIKSEDRSALNVVF